MSTYYNIPRLRDRGSAGLLPSAECQMLFNIQIWRIYHTFEERKNVLPTVLTKQGFEYYYLREMLRRCLSFRLWFGITGIPHYSTNFPIIKQRRLLLRTNSQVVPSGEISNADINFISSAKLSEPAPNKKRGNRKQQKRLTVSTEFLSKHSSSFQRQLSN